MLRMYFRPAFVWIYTDAESSLPTTKDCSRLVKFYCDKISRE